MPKKSKEDIVVKENKLSGYVRVYRSLFDMGYSMECVGFYIYLLSKATHKPIQRFRDGVSVMLEPGQFITGRKKLSAETKINESKVQRMLIFFENEQLIEQQTSNTSRCISMLKWDIYQHNEQHNEQPVNNERTTSEQPVNTRQEHNNKKNIKETTQTLEDKITNKRKELTLASTERLKTFTVERRTKVLGEFLSYWTEPNHNTGKLRVDGEKFFDVPRRLTTWLKNERISPDNTQYDGPEIFQGILE